MNFNVTYAENNKINITSQNTLTVSKMVINEVVDTSCDLIEETNIDIDILVDILIVLRNYPMVYENPVYKYSVAMSMGTLNADESNFEVKPRNS